MHLSSEFFFHFNNTIFTFIKRKEENILYGLTEANKMDRFCYLIEIKSKMMEIKGNNNNIKIKKQTKGKSNSTTSRIRYYKD